MTAPTVVEHRYRPRGAAKQLLECRDDEVLMSGPAGTGKSRACLQKLHYMALLNPGLRALIVRKTAVSLSSSALVTYEKHVAAESIKAGHVHWYGGSQKEAAAWRYTNGSVINVGGMDKPSKIMSTEYDVVFAQEAIELTPDDWEAIISRLRNGVTSFQQLIADTNPASNSHWLKQRADRGDVRMLHSKHEDNPRLFDEVIRSEQGRHVVEYVVTTQGAAYIAKLDRLTGVRKLRLRGGLWVAAEGMIYEDEWSEGDNLVDPFKIPDAWTRWWAVDFGYRHAFVLQNWAEDPDGRSYLYREIYRTRRLVEDHAKDIMRIVAPGTEWKLDASGDVSVIHGKWREPKPRAIVCDHDAEDRGTLERYLGLSTTPARKSVSDGIQAVQGRMRLDGDGRRRLFIVRDCVVHRDEHQAEAGLPTCTAEEIPGYVWEDSKKKEQPVKENDDGCDSMRYYVAERDLGARPRVRFMG